MFKKLITLAAISLVLFSLAVPASASNKELGAAEYELSDAVFIAGEISNYNLEYNEYEAIASLAKESDASLAKKGYSKADIESIKNYKAVFAEHIKSLNADYTDETLLEAGYTAEEIKIIRDFENMSPSLQSAYSPQLAANLSLNLSAKNPLSYTGGVNKITLNYKFDWTRMPTMKYTDKFGLSWSNANFIIDTTAHPNGIVPITMNYVAMPYTTNITASLHGNGIMYDIPMKLGNGAHIGDNAEGNLTLRYSGSKVREMAVQLDYAHAKMPTGLSFTLPGGVVGYTFSPSATTDCIWNYTIFRQ